MLTKSWSIGCSPRRNMASAGDAIGWTWRGMPIPRLRKRPLLPERLALSRLRHPVVQRRQAVQRVRAGADRRPTRSGRTTTNSRAFTSCQAESRPIWNARIGTGHVHGRPHGSVVGARWRAVAVRAPDRHGGYDRRGVSRPDAGLRPLPRSQVRSDHARRITTACRRFSPAASRREIPAVDAVKVITYWKSITKQLEVEQLKAEIKRIDDQVRNRTGTPQGS